MRTLFLAGLGGLTALSAWAQPMTPLAEVPFAGYGEARVTRDCASQTIGASQWSGECRLSGDLAGGTFTLPLDHTFRFGSAGCALVLKGARSPADIACRRLGQQFGSWIEVSEILGTPCRAAGTLWSRVAASTESDRLPPVAYVIKVELELTIEPDQAACEAGIWSETRYYHLCAEPPVPDLAARSWNEQVCGSGVEFLSFEAVHRSLKELTPITRGIGGCSRKCARRHEPRGSENAPRRGPWQ